MRSSVRTFAFLVALGSALPSLAEEPDFDNEVLPILRARCSSCHTGPKRQGGLTMNTRAGLVSGGESGPAFVAGKSSESELVRRVLSTKRKERMPPKGERLSAAQIDVLRRWIDADAPWTDGFSFGKTHRRASLAPRMPDLPTIAGVEHPVDRLVVEYWNGNEVEVGKSDVVSDAVFARRVSLDLVGLLPTPEELRAFERDSRPDKRARLVDRLLANRRDYADHWLTFWNDALRNAYRGTGFIDNGRQQITGWLYDALWENKPYDEFVRELLAPGPGANGFTRGIKWRGVVNESQRPEIQAAQNVAQVFLGTNLKCASCHDSFVNNWKLTDAYALASVFSEKPLELHRCDKPTGEISEVRFLFPELGSIDAAAPRKERMRRLAQLMTMPENGRLTRTIVNRLWARLLGRGLVEPLDDLDAAPWSQDLLDWLASDLAANSYDLKRTLRLITTSRAYQLESVAAGEREDEAFVFLGPRVKRMSAEQFVDAAHAVTGVSNAATGLAKKRDGRGQGGQLEAIAATRSRDSAPKATPPKRNVDTRSARWIWSTDSSNAAAAGEEAWFRKTFTLSAESRRTRIIATADNELELFIDGRRIAASTEWNAPVKITLDRPLSAGSHVIAARARNAGASPNAAGFVCVVVGLDGDGAPDWTLSSDKTWLASTKPRKGFAKLELDTNGWNHSFEIGALNSPPWNIAQHFTLGGTTDSLELRAALAIADTLLVALGRPNREQVVTRRDSVATLLQALELTNGSTLDRILQKGAAEQIARDSDPDTLIEELWLRGLGRRPNEAEARVLHELVGATTNAEGLADAMWLLLMLPEFQLIY